MFEYIDKLRKSPEPVRRRFVAAFSTSVVAAIALAWGTSLVWRIQSGYFVSEANSASSSFSTSGAVESWKQFLQGVDDLVDTTSRAFETAPEGAPDALPDSASGATSSPDSDIIEVN